MSDLYLELRTRIPLVTSWVPVGTIRLQEAQDATGLSNERLARQIPVSVKTWERWKKRGEVPADSIPAVARVLGVEIRRADGRPIDVPVNGSRFGLDDDLAGRFEGLAYIVREQAAGITEEIRRLPRPEAPDPDLLLAELAALRSGMERVEAGLARLADRLEPPSEAVGP